MVSVKKSEWMSFPVKRPVWRPGKWKFRKFQKISGWVFHDLLSFLPALHCKIRIIFFKFMFLCMYKWSRNSSFSIFWSRDWFNINLRKPLKVNNGIQFSYDSSFSSWRIFIRFSENHHTAKNTESRDSRTAWCALLCQWKTSVSFLTWPRIWFKN